MREHEEGTHHSYVLLNHENAEENLAHLIDGYVKGNGVRAVAHAIGEGNFTHVLSLSAPSREQLDDLKGSLPRGASPPSSTIDVCTDVPCQEVVNVLAWRPSWMPPWREMVFAKITLSASIHDRHFELPDLQSPAAGGVVDLGGKVLLIEFGAENSEVINEDLERLRGHPMVDQIDVMRTSGEKIVRAEP